MSFLLNDGHHAHANDATGGSGPYDNVQYKPYPVQQMYDAFNTAGGPSTISFLDVVGSMPYDTIKDLLLKDASVVHQKGFNGLHPLHRASLRGDMGILQLLLSYGADPNAANDFSETPLHYACKRGNICIIHQLLEHGANLNAEDQAGKGAMHHAAHGGGVLAIHYLQEVCGLSTHVRDRNLSTPMHIICLHGHVEAFDYFLKKERSDLLSRDAQGNTPMHIAASNGNGWMCWRLLECLGYQALHEVNAEGCTPLELAKRGISAKYLDLVTLLSYYYRRSARVGIAQKFVGMTPAWYGLLVMPFVFYPFFLLLTLCFNNPGPVTLLGVVIMLAIRTFHSHRVNHVSRMPSPAHASLFAAGMLYTMLCYYVLILPTVYVELGYLFIILSILCTPVMLYMYWKLLTVDPGLCRQPRQKPEPGQFYTTRDIAVGSLTADNFCHVCEMIPPTWSTHCKLCCKCYQYTDHHCLYLYRCIAVNNHHLFIFFNLVVLLSMMMFEYSCVVYLWSYYPNEQLLSSSILKSVFVAHPYIWSLFVLNSLSVVWDLWLLKVQLSNISSGRLLPYRPPLTTSTVNFSRRQKLANVVHFFMRKPLPYLTEV